MPILRRIGNALRPGLVLLAVFLVIGFAVIAYQGVRTLQQLAAVETDRDRWQRPDEIIQALDLKQGNVVVDFGSGAGYFALKASDAVGDKGQVIAVDLRNLSLLFLKVRALLRGKHNIRTVVGDADNPHLPTATADAVLIANTYHELTAPQAILRHLHTALRTGGRLVIVDRAPSAGEGRLLENGATHHIALDAVQADLLQTGFNIVSRTDTFIHPPGDDVWWLLVASKSSS